MVLSGTARSGRQNRERTDSRQIQQSGTPLCYSPDKGIEHEPQALILILTEAYNYTIIVVESDIKT